MVLSNSSSAHAWSPPPAYRQVLHTLAPLGAFIVAWWMSGLITTQFVWNEVLLYSTSHLVLIGLRRSSLLHASLTAGLSLLLDLVFSIVLLYQSSVLGLAFFPLYALIAFRALSVYWSTPVVTIIPFVLGPIFLFTRSLSTPYAALPIGEQRGAVILLLGSLGFGIVGIWASTRIVRSNTQLKHNLDSAQRAADVRVSELERSTNDLRARMREQHALEEGLRVITSSLSLDEVLAQIVDSTVHMLGAERVGGVALSLANDDGYTHRFSSDDKAIGLHFADQVAGRTLAAQQPLIINDLMQDTTFSDRDHGFASALSVPLFVGEGPARGALMVGGVDRGSFDSIDARHLAALASQAGIAMQNAELHSRMLQQRQLLESVMRDITEGMVVLNGQQQVVLMNPLGRRLLNGVAGGRTVREQILDMVTAMQAENRAIITREIRIGGDDDEANGSFYQAWGSLVRQHGSTDPLIAVVLHDITAQKAEERGKQEFISMVAHELRNPLHSMNGFMKLVLQGKVGALNEMQQDFLGIVDSQIGLLNGRISELLEYNRVQAGRLVLNPQRGDMPLLVVGTVMRLSLQAEQNGLSLINDVAPDLPECYFDSERIGQVLTNLIENAMKATPPGGTIRVFSELHEDELWMRVSDTGVGIAPEDRTKIFQAFYRAHDQASSRGNHLGLGLAICAQIVEGHRGRMWVDSELGKGSCFSFALPLLDRERQVGASLEVTNL